MVESTGRSEKFMSSNLTFPVGRLISDRACTIPSCPHARGIIASKEF